MLAGKSVHARLEVAINIYESKKEMFSINYVHSRRAFPEDRLYIPNRPKDAARDVLEEFFEELESLAKSEKLSPMYADAFSPSQTRRGKLRHWLLRSVHVEDGDLAKLRKQGVSMIGDVVNVEPIVGRCPVVPIMSSHRLCVLHTNLRWDGEVVWTFRTGTSQDTSSPSPSPGKRMLQHVWKTYMLSSQQRLRFENCQHQTAMVVVGRSYPGSLSRLLDFMGLFFLSLKSAFLRLYVSLIGSLFGICSLRYLAISSTAPFTKTSR
jgi:hypothetical protein